MESFAWPFSRRRQEWIGIADELIVTIDSGLFDLERAPVTHAGTKEVRKAAKVLEEAASFYLRAGLGLAAKRCYERAARAFSLIGSSSGIARCVAAAEGVSTFWEED
jgi:hypothetical protein